MPVHGAGAVPSDRARTRYDNAYGGVGLRRKGVGGNLRTPHCSSTERARPQRLAHHEHGRNEAANAEQNTHGLRAPRRQGQQRQAAARARRARLQGPVDLEPEGRVGRAEQQLRDPRANAAPRATARARARAHGYLQLAPKARRRGAERQQHAPTEAHAQPVQQPQVEDGGTRERGRLARHRAQRPHGVIAPGATPHLGRVRHAGCRTRARTVGAAWNCSPLR